MINFVVMGNPIPKGRPRLSKWGTYTPKTTVQYEKLVRDTFISKGYQKLNGGVILTLNIYIQIPKSTSKKMKEEMENQYHTGKKDADNIIKAVTDAMNGYAYDDDGQICEIYATKKWSEYPRVVIQLQEV